MQTKFVKNAVIAIASTVLVFSLVVSCQKSNYEEEKSLSDGANQVGATAKIPEGISQATPPYDLDVILRGEGKSFGYTMFRQDPDPAKIIALNTWVRNLATNHRYLLQRAVDTNIDGNCTGTSWLTLGRGLDPQAIVTDKKGNGYAELWRDISAVPTGARFDIHFRVVDAITLAVVLTSDCYQYTVR